MKTRILSFALVVAALFAFTIAPASARYPNCSSISYCSGSTSCPCTCYAGSTWWSSTCGAGCALPDILTLQAGDAGLPSTVLSDLGIVAYSAR